MSGTPGSKNAVGATGQSSTWNRVHSLASWACQYLAGPCPSCRASRLAASGEELLGQGFATEAAKGSLRVAFERLNLDEVVSFTSLINRPSRAVMERIGMVNTGEDFDHPALPEGSELRRHCLYKITRAQWRSSDALVRS